LGDFTTGPQKARAQRDVCAAMDRVFEIRSGQRTRKEVKLQGSETFT